MTVLVGNGFYLPTALGVSGAAQGTVLTAGDLLQVFDIQTDASLANGINAMHAGDSIIVDTDSDGDFTDETQTTQTDNDRFVNSTVTFADGTTTTVTLELVSLSDGSQAILIQDPFVRFVNGGSDEIQSITLGTFNTQFDNRYSQANFNNTITNTVVCFCETTRLRTPKGEQTIGSLAAGDEVITADDGPQIIKWIGTRPLSSAQLVASPHLRPICISAGALGDGIPESDLMVSPQHRILIISKIAERMFGQREIFVPAIKLLGVDGIEQVTSFKPVTYVHVLFTKHQIVFANGACAESLFTGPQAFKALPPEARKEILEIFPNLLEEDQFQTCAHPTLQKQALVDELLERHRKNHKHLVLSGR